MKINIAEDAIVKLLREAVQNKFAVESFPADLQKYLETFRHANGAILVQYVHTKREYKTRISGYKTLTFEISAVSKNLKPLVAHQGIYSMLDTTFDALSGTTFTEQGIKGLTLFATEEEYQAFYMKNGLWVYTQTYESDEIPFIKQIEETDVLLTRITADSVGDEAIVEESESV